MTNSFAGNGVHEVRTTLEEFLNRPVKFSTKVFRGVSDSSYSLTTTMGRLNRPQSVLEAYEKELMYEFKMRARPFLAREPASELEWLFMAQHYGLPTRLLDWTTNPLVALYFATAGDKEVEFVVFVRLITRWLVHEAPHPNPYDLDDDLGLRPPCTDARYINQSGVFTIHPKYEVTPTATRIIKFVFPAEVRQQARDRLAQYGILPSFIYPGLAGIAKDIKQAVPPPEADGSRRTDAFWDWA